jgi:sensor histidine kinase regulating citrate/malate metabolism
LALIIEFTIWEIATLNTKNALLSMQIKEERKQFEETKKIMETLNQRGHDLKHLLQDYSGNLPEKYLKTVREEVQLYENRYITDNPSLDVLLTNFNYKYGKLGVKLKFVGDSSLLKFMDEMDMVVLFDNALGNAVDAVLKVGQEKRTIQIILDKKGNMISLVFINYFDGKLQIKNQKLQSSKESKNLYEHGVGLASMKAIANNYDGNIDFYTENEKFYLNVYLFDNSQAKF